AAMSAGQVIAGFVTSLTVNATTQVWLLLAASVTVTVIGCEPAPETVAPCAGFCVTVNEPLAVQPSDDCALTSARTAAATAWQLASAFAVCAGTRLHAITGLVLSITVKPTTQVSLLLLASVTVTVIGCEPAPLTTLP